MVFEEIDWVYIIPVFVSQLFVSSIFFIMAFKILRRNNSQLGIIIFCFYISVAMAFVINLILIFSIKTNPTIYILSFISIFLLFFSNIFFFLFNLLLLKHELIKIKLQVAIIISYGVVVMILLLLPGGLIIDETTNWRGYWTFSYCITLIIFFTCVIFIPSIILLIKIYSSFEDDDLKKKWRYFVIGYCGNVEAFYGYLFYLATTDPFIKMIIAINSLIVIPAGILIYFGIAQQLK